MDLHVGGAGRPNENDYLYSRRAAWFAFVMTCGLMLFDYIDRQVIVSLFPHLKQEWGLSDKQLGALASIVSVTVALGAIPVALIADRASRVKSIAAMAIVWSLASISCMFTRNYGQLLAARGVIGLGEAGYGSVGAAMVALVASDATSTSSEASESGVRVDADERVVTRGDTRLLVTVFEFEAVRTETPSTATSPAADRLSVVSLVSQGLGVALVPEALQASRLPDTVFIPLASESTPYDTYCLWKTARDHAAMEAFLDTVRSAKLVA